MDLHKFNVCTYICQKVTWKLLHSFCETFHQNNQNNRILTQSNSTLVMQVFFCSGTLQKQPFEILFKISVLKNCATFTGKQLCWSVILVKLQTWRPATLLKESPTQAFCSEFCENIKNSFFNRTPSVAASITTC